MMAIRPKTLHSRPLCRTFGTEAEKILVDLGRASGARLIRGEETITDDLLLNVQTAHPYEVITYQFNKREEPFTGADWEWWLTDGHLWYGLLIQAKRLDLNSHKYPQIKKLVGKPGTPQIDLLIEQARLKHIDPLYFFYNYSTGNPSALTWNCGTTPFDLYQLGCMVAHAGAVKRVLGNGGAGLPRISPISYPLRCLVCCPVLAKGFALQIAPVRIGGRLAEAPPGFWEQAPPTAASRVVKQLIVDQRGRTAIPGIVRAEAKVALPREDEGAGARVANLEPHRVIRPADPCHDADKGLIGAEL